MLFRGLPEKLSDKSRQFIHACLQSSIAMREQLVNSCGGFVLQDFDTVVNVMRFIEWIKHQQRYDETIGGCHEVFHLRQDKSNVFIPGTVVKWLDLDLQFPDAADLVVDPKKMFAVKTDLIRSMADFYTLLPKFKYRVKRFCTFDMSLGFKCDTFNPSYDMDRVLQWYILQDIIRSEAPFGAGWVSFDEPKLLLVQPHEFASMGELFTPIKARQSKQVTFL